MYDGLSCIVVQPVDLRYTALSWSDSVAELLIIILSLLVELCSAEGAGTGVATKGILFDECALFFTIMRHKRPTINIQMRLKHTTATKTPSVIPNCAVDWENNVFRGSISDTIVMNNNLLSLDDVIMTETLLEVEVLVDVDDIDTSNEITMPEADTLS